MPETRSLHSKLAQVMYEAERIPKRGKAPAVMGGFPFVQVGDAADYIRKALAEHQISMLPSSVEVLDKTEHQTKAGGSMTTVDLRVTWTLTDGVTGETATIQSYGAGADGGDKYSGKATTSAMKYALLAGFLLSTGDDVELSDTSDRRPRQTAPAAPVEPDDGSLIGIAEVGKVGSGADFELRQTPEGPIAAFRLKQGRSGYKVVAHGALAIALAGMKPEGQRVKVWGSMQPETWTPEGSRTPVTYNVVNLERMEGPDFVIPAVEAPTVPMFDDDEAAAILAAELAESAA